MPVKNKELIKKSGLKSIIILFSLLTIVLTIGSVTIYQVARAWFIFEDPFLKNLRAPSLQLKTVKVISPTPTPTRAVTNQIINPTSISYPTTIPSSPVAVTTPAIGGPQPPAGYYCIDDVDPDMCDDNTSHLVPKGSGGVSGSCGTVIENAHRLVEALPQVNKGTRDSLSRTVSTNCGSTGPSTGYVSTFFVIDAYNLSGFLELNKANPSHVSPSGLFNWWQSPPARYEFIQYSPGVVQQFATGQIDLTGCAMFLRLGSGSFHVGIINKLELYSSNGDGVLSILQSGTRMYIDRFPVAGWNIANTSTNQTNTSGVEGFGCHQ